MDWTKQQQLPLGKSGEYPTYTPNVAGFVVGTVWGSGDPYKRQLCWVGAGVGIVGVGATGGNFIYDVGDDGTRYWCNTNQAFCLPVSANWSFYVGYKMGGNNQSAPRPFAFWVPAAIAGDANNGLTGPDFQKMLDDARVSDPSDAEGKVKG
jgi:hypothetical protein